MRVTIECNVLDLKFSVGYETSYIPLEEHRAFSEFVAGEISNQIIKAIDDQRFRSKWEALNVDYLEWKRKHELSLKTWEATGLLKSQISYDRVRDVIKVGIDPYAVYKDTGVSVLQVAKWMEYGNDRLPERPLFRPILINTRKSIKRMYKKFLNGPTSSPSRVWGDTLLQEFVEQHKL